MQPKKNSSIDELMDALSGDIVDIQRTLDKRFIKDVIQFKSAFDQATDKQTFLMITNFPKSQVVTRHEVTSRIELEIEKSGKSSISVSLLNLSADLRFKRNNSNDSSIKIELIQIPITSSSK